MRVTAGLLLVLAIAATCGPASVAAGGPPAPGAPLSISYQGSFDLTNTMIPEGMQHSYDYHVEWAYSWQGTWGELFPGSNPRSNQTSFGRSHIAGVLHVQWRNTASGPNLRCTLRIVPDTGDYPDFRAVYDAARGAIRIVGLEAPTYRYGVYVGSSDPMCGGGPQIDIFGQPAGWKPLGDGGASLSLTGSGIHHYDRTWTWRHAFGHGLSRSYESAMRSTLQVRISG